jgi:hypothetical protein
MTAPALIARPAREQFPPCPPWCTRHVEDSEYLIHRAVLRWELESEDAFGPVFEAIYYRADEVGEVGMADMEIVITGVGTGAPEIWSSLTAEAVRCLSQTLSAWADEIDPHHNNGVGHPVTEWTAT